MSPKKSDGWSVMGTGTIATEHMVLAIRSTGHRPLWVVSRNREYARSFSEDMDIPHKTTDVRKPLSDQEVGFVYVSAQRDRRKHYISSALASAKHVLSDGPISSSSSIAEALVGVSRDARALMVVNQPFRASKIHQAMKRFYEEGEIGELRSIVIMRCTPFQPRPQRRSDVEEKAENILLDVSVDDIDLARFLSGKEPSQAASIAMPDKQGSRQIAYTIEMTDHVLFQAYESLGMPEFESVVMMAGDHGTLTAHGTLDTKGLGTLMRRNGARNELVPVRERDPYHATVEEFLATTERPSAWLSTGHDNLVALKTAEAIASSMKRGRLVSV